MRLLFLASGLLSASLAQAQPFQPQVATESQTLFQCSQTSVSAMMFIDVADAALFSSDCSTLPRLAEEVQISFIYHREFAAEDFIEAAETLLKRNLSKAEYQQIEADLNSFNEPYQDVVEGDRYDVRSTADGLKLLKNGEIISQNTSKILSKKYFKIWFGTQPFNKKLKKALLKSDR